MYIIYWRVYKSSTIWGKCLLHLEIKSGQILHLFLLIITKCTNEHRSQPTTPSPSPASYSFCFTCSIHLDSRNPFTGHVVKLFLHISSTTLDTSYLTSPQKLAAQRILVADTLLIKRDFRIWTKSAKNIWRASLAFRNVHRFRFRVSCHLILNALLQHPTPTTPHHPSPAQPFPENL